MKRKPPTEKAMKKALAKWEKCHDVEEFTNHQLDVLFYALFGSYPSENNLKKTEC